MAGGGGGNVFAGRSALATATPRLLIYCLIYSLGSIFFGYDGASFGGVQAFSPFLRQFGTFNSVEGEEEYFLPATTTALMNSLPLLGKFLGSLVVGPLIEKYGHKKTMGFTCLVQIVGAVIQVTSRKAAQFIVGRFFVYTAVGLVENVVPTYQSEIAPAALRGFFVGSIQVCLTFGSLIAGVVNEAMSSRVENAGWQIATAIQAAPAVLILSALWWTPLSPRWLVFNDREEEALKVLRSVRRGEDVAVGLPELEIAAMRADWGPHHVAGTRRVKGQWGDLFKGGNGRRTGIACTIMIFQQLTGVTFSSSYGPTFYKSVGLGDMAFTYAVINNAVSVVTAFAAMIMLDKYGRRTLVFHGGWSQGAFLIAVGVLGMLSTAHPETKNINQSNGVVAGMILYSAILHMTLGPAAYITAAEVGTQDLREKTMALSTAMNVVAGFVVVFVTPYLLDDIGAGLAYIWGGFAFLVSVWAWFCMPELKGRNLEEIDELFEAKMPARKFAGYETKGEAGMVSKVEDGTIAKKTLDGEVEEQNAEAIEMAG